jgi:hypothetical protein
MEKKTGAMNGTAKSTHGAKISKPDYFTIPS